jgi:hypothetical protein
MLRRAFKEKKLTLFLGAGVSMGSKLPSWDKLVLLMYFNKISQEKMEGWRPYSNYLYAIAEWHLKNSTEPLEVTARKLRKHYKDSDQNLFIEDLYSTLYGNFMVNGFPDPQIDKDFLRKNNATLKALAKLCESSKKGVSAVLSYNYDSLFEMVLGNLSHQTIFKPVKPEPEKLPIYHVHGYVPLNPEQDGSQSEDIVFTEDQYHRIAENPYSWSNLVQLQLLSNTTGLMVGLSLSDRNMRRLLDAVQHSPINSLNYALLQEPDNSPPDDNILDQIHQKAKDYLREFEESGIKRDTPYDGIMFPHPGYKSEYPNIKSSRSGEKGPRYRVEIAGIIEQVKLIDKDQQEYVLKQMGIIPIWYKKHTEIPGIINRIFE